MKKQQKPVHGEYVDLEGTPFFMGVTDRAIYGYSGWSWEALLTSEAMPEWVGEALCVADYEADGRCDTLAEAQTAALKAAKAAFKKYKRDVTKLGVKLSKQIAKDLAELEEGP